MSSNKLFSLSDFVFFFVIKFLKSSLKSFLACVTSLFSFSMSLSFEILFEDLGLRFLHSCSNRSSICASISICYYSNFKTFRLFILSYFYYSLSISKILSLYSFDKSITADFFILESKRPL